MPPSRDPLFERRLESRLQVATAMSTCPLGAVYKLEGDRAVLLAQVGIEGLPEEVPAWRVAREKVVRVPIVGRGPAAPESALFPPTQPIGALISVPIHSGADQVAAVVLADLSPREDLVSMSSEALIALSRIMAELFEPEVAPLPEPGPKRRSDRSLPPLTAEIAAWPLTDGQHDPVTGLPDRRMLSEPIRQAIAKAEHAHGGVAVALLALDRFQRIDDWLGRTVSDELMTQIAERLLETSSDMDLIGRSSGDEFIVVFTGLAEGQTALPRADRMLQAVREPFHVHGYELSISATMGLSRFPEDASDSTTLLRYAGIALHRAKKSRHRGQVESFTDELRLAVEQRGDLERHLRRALGGGELRVYFQPKIDLKSRVVFGAEALIRWQRGDVIESPGTFLSVAEESELIVPIGTWVMLESCRQMMVWRRKGMDIESVSVNVSALQFSRPDFIGTVKRVLKSTSLPPGCLELEVTETSLMDNVAAAADTLRALRELGVAVSVDDFGTGYSSLAYLQQLPVDILKIDRSFIKDLDAEGKAGGLARSLTEAITGLGHSLGLKVLAEGVETEAQLAALEALGCDAVQGFYFSKPVPAPELELFLKRAD